MTASSPARAAVYRRRRFVAIGLALVLLVGLGFGIAAIVGAARSGEPAAAATTPTPTPTVTPTPTPTVEATQGYQPVACEPGALRIEEPAAPAVYEPSRPIPFEIVVVNRGSVPCLIDAGVASLGVVVYSGADRVWSSVDCPSEDATLEQEMLLDVGVQADLAVVWNQARSAPGCPEQQATAAQGTYRAVVTTDGGGTALLGWERAFRIGDPAQQ